MADGATDELEHLTSASEGRAGAGADGAGGADDDGDVGMDGGSGDEGDDGFGFDGEEDDGGDEPSAFPGEGPFAGAASAGAAPASSAAAASSASGVAAGGSGSSAGSAPAAAAGAGAGAAAAPPAPLPLRPILRGKVAAAAGSHVGIYVLEGRWAMVETDTVWSEFRYTFLLHTAAAPTPPDGVYPLNPALPSSQAHSPASVTLSGYFMTASTTVPPGPPVKTVEKDVKLRIGGPVPPDAPVPLQTPDGPAAAADLVGVTGDGAVGLWRYNIAGAYHASTGTLWLRKVFSAKVPVVGGGRGGGAGRGRGVPRSRGTVVDPSAIVVTPRERKPVAPSAVGLPPSKMTSDQRLCSELLSALRRDRTRTSFFQTPVDPVRDQALNYYTVVKNPMDLGTVRTKLEAGQYETVEAFASDVRLVFDNAMIYNPPTHYVHRAAREAKDMFEMSLSKSLASRAKREEEMKAAAERRMVEGDAMRRTGSDGKRKSMGGGGGGMDDDDESSTLSGAVGSSAAKKPRASAGGGGASGFKRPRSELSKRASYDGDGGDYDDAYLDDEGGGGRYRPSRRRGDGGGGGGGGADPEKEELLRQMAELRSQMAVLVKSTTAMAGSLAAGAVAGTHPNLGSLAGVPALTHMPAYSAPPRKRSGGTPSGSRAKRARYDDDDEDYADEDDDTDADYRGPAPSRRALAKAHHAPAPAAARAAAASSSGHVAAPAVHLQPVSASMSLAEKTQLVELVGTLDGDHITQVLSIIQSRMSVAESAGEIELDLDAIDPDTLREIQRYAYKAVGKQLPPSAEDYFKRRAGASAIGGGGAGIGVAPKPAPVPLASSASSAAGFAAAHAAHAAAGHRPVPLPPAPLPRPPAPAAAAPMPTVAAAVAAAAAAPPADDESDDDEAPPPPPSRV